MGEGLKRVARACGGLTVTSGGKTTRYNADGKDVAVVRASKFLALVLRHHPERIGSTLDAEGWADIDEIIAKSEGRLTRDLIDRAVAENDKKRYGISEDGKRIRARQGHSVEVDLKLEPVTPPRYLYHGTHPGAVEAIRAGGLSKMGRQYVHLSADFATARKVGARRGKPIVFAVGARSMHLLGREFFQAENGVWLTDHVPPGFLLEVDGDVRE